MRENIRLYDKPGYSHENKLKPQLNPFKLLFHNRPVRQGSISSAEKNFEDICLNIKIII